MSMDEKIAILLATYNGSKYLTYQLDSILRQTYVNWELFICDDCSNDNTKEIMEIYANKDIRIHILFNKVNLGPAQNFSKLINIALNFKYVMFSDQDDIWIDNKIELEYSKILEAENKYGKIIPLLVYSNLRYVDKNLNIINKKIPYIKTKSLSTLLGYNYIWGCTILMNQTMTKVVCPIPKQAQNHDYWIALHGELLGKNIFLDKKTVLYRQHGNNATGGPAKYNYLKKIVNIKKYYKSYQTQTNQNLLFCSKYADRKNINLQQYEEVFYNHGIQAILYAQKLGLKRSTLLDTIFYYFYLLTKN